MARSALPIVYFLILLKFDSYFFAQNRDTQAMEKSTTNYFVNESPTGSLNDNRRIDKPNIIKNNTSPIVQA
jgi:hypothetical protein